MGHSVQHIRNERPATPEPVFLQKALAGPWESKPEAQEAWIFSYKQLRQNPGENETGCFADGTHPIHNTQLSDGWIRKGV